MKKGLIMLLLCLALSPAAAFADTLAQMREALPGSVTLRIDGQPVAVPVLLPEGEALPIIKARTRCDLDEQAVNAEYPSRYPLQHGGRPAPSIYVDRWAGEGENRPQPPQGAQRGWGLARPEGCDVPGHRPAQIMQDMLRFAGAGDADVRVLYQIASSAARLQGAALPSFGGMWQTQFEQWIEGAPLFAAFYRPTKEWKMGWADAEGTRRYLFWPYQQIRLNMRAEDDLTASVYMLFEVERRLSADTELAPFEAVLRTVQSRIDEGRLRSVHALRLGYTNLVAAGTDRPADNAQRVHVLVPAWQVLGYDTKDSLESVLELYTAPSGEALFVQGHTEGCLAELRIDARNARVLEDYRYE